MRARIQAGWRLDMEALRVREAIRHSKQRSGRYYAIQVTRHDAGGVLWAPGRIVHNHYVDCGATPSYDETAVRRRCDQLNARRPRDQR